MIDHQILPFLSQFLLPFFSNSSYRNKTPAGKKRTHSMSNAPDQADDHRTNEAPRAGRRITRQAANRTSHSNRLQQTGNAISRETAAGNRAIVQRVRGGSRQGMLARSGLVQDAGGNLLRALADIASRGMAAAPRPQTRAAMARRQLHRADVTTTSVAPAKVMPGSGYDARQTQAEAINNGGPAQERRRRRRNCPSSSRSVRGFLTASTIVRPRTRVTVIVNSHGQRSRERAVRETPQGTQPMSIDQPIWGVDRRANHESGREQEAAQFNVQGQPVQQTDAGVVEHHVENENRIRLPQHPMPIQRNIITEEFRARMFEYLGTMQRNGEVKQDTRNLSQFLLNRYCTVGNISEENWQLVATAVLFLAAKYEEVWPPQATRFGQRRFTLSEIVLTEQAILKALDYKITIPKAFDYVRCFIKSANSGEEEENLALSLANFCLTEMGTRSSPAYIAAAAVYAAQCSIRGAPQWTNRLEHHTGYTGGELEGCAFPLLQLLARNNVA